jgi:catechol-2,3-dioxygenase
MSVVTEKPTPTKRRLDQEFPGRVMPSKLAHAVFKTPDLARARAWYLDVLNAKVASENQQVCFITYDDEHHRLGFIQMPNLVAPTPNRWGLEHYAFSWRSANPVQVPQNQRHHALLDR